MTVTKATPRPTRAHPKLRVATSTTIRVPNTTMKLTAIAIERRIVRCCAWGSTPGPYLGRLVLEGSVMVCGLRWSSGSRA